MAQPKLALPQTLEAGVATNFLLNPVSFAAAHNLSVLHFGFPPEIEDNVRSN
jgi:hypothetical protein